MSNFQVYSTAEIRCSLRRLLRRTQAFVSRYQIPPGFNSAIYWLGNFCGRPTMVSKRYVHSKFLESVIKLLWEKMRLGKGSSEEEFILDYLSGFLIQSQISLKEKKIKKF